MSVTILGPLAQGGIKLPFYSFKVPAGFPSPAADHIERHISLDELFDIRAPHVYLVMIDGDSMQGAGIYSGDLVIVDCSAVPEHDSIVVVSLNGEPICKRLFMQNGILALQSDNPHYPTRYILEGDELQIFGVVKYSVRDHEKA